MNSEEKPIEILLVEDNFGDAYLTKKAFETAQISTNITVATDGDMAIDMLLKKEGYRDCVRPDLILLDINLPKKNGHKVLEEIKGHRNLKRIPVIMLTSSTAEQDVIQSYDRYANGYISKPVDLEQYKETIAAIEQYWYCIVILPPS